MKNGNPDLNSANEIVAENGSFQKCNWMLNRNTFTAIAMAYICKNVSSSKVFKKKILPKMMTNETISEMTCAVNF